MSFDPIANGWRKLLNRSTETKTVLTGTLEEGGFEAQEKSDIVAGKMYTLALTDGRESHVVGTAVTKEISGTVWGGNLYLLIGENKDELDTGEPFAFCTADGYTGVFVEGVNNPDFTLTTTETVHTIDPMYLPSGMGGVLPVLTLSADTIVAAYNSESLAANVNEREATEIFYALNCGMPLVVKNEVAEGVLDIAAVSVLNYTGAEFSGEFMGVKFTITSIANGNPTIHFTPIES